MKLRSSSLVKAIQPVRLRALVWALFVLGCSSREERELVHADGEIFNAVARSQLAATGESTAVAKGALRFDARPAGDNVVLAVSPDRPRPLDLDSTSDSVSSDALAVITEQRKDILKSIGVEEGGPFVYPDCAGARSQRVRDSSVALPAPRCPESVRRYVTVGLPFRGASHMLDKVRPPETPLPDTTAELWTVLVTESSVGPGGQQWRQYVSLFRRDQGDGQLRVAERYLLSWAE